MLLYVYNVSQDDTKIIPNADISKKEIEQLLGRQMTTAENRLYEKAAKDVASNCDSDATIVNNNLIRVLLLVGKEKIHFTKTELNLLSSAWERGAVQTAVSYETNLKSLLKDILKHHINVVIATSSANTDIANALKEQNCQFHFVSNAEAVRENELDILFGQKPTSCLNVAEAMAHELCD